METILKLRYHGDLESVDSSASVQTSVCFNTSNFIQFKYNLFTRTSVKQYSDSWFNNKKEIVLIVEVILWNVCVIVLFKWLFLDQISLMQQSRSQNIKLISILNILQIS